MRYLPVAPHNPTGPVMNAMTIHLAASIPNFQILETIAVDVPWRKDLQFTAGEIIVPTKPGLGVELDEKACERYPHKTHHIPFFDGSLNAELRDDYQPFVR
jgi:galactonate dehydratase